MERLRSDSLRHNVLRIVRSIWWLHRRRTERYDLKRLYAAYDASLTTWTIRPAQQMTGKRRSLVVEPPSDSTTQTA